MIRLFLSYSHQDEDLRKELEKHLAALRRDGVIDIWQDRRIGPGDEFDREISNQLESADIVLLLVSSDFLHSDYCYDIEMKRALERHAEDSARVIPVILRPCDWQKTPLGKLNATPTDGKPVIEHASLDRGFLEVARAVRTATEELQPIALATGAHDVTPVVGDRPDRSSNLRIKRQFSDRDRHRFLDDGFEYIAGYFENSLKELETRNPGVETSFKRIDANHFEAIAYVNGEEQSRCGIWQGDGSSIMEGIPFSYSGIGQGNSYNESMSVGDNGYTLFLEPMGMAHFRQEKDKELTHDGAAEYYWSLFIERLR
ncbi:MAG: toll/interleukin-1 receptor domain-containing protein [Candidatus Thiodiazotropha sp. (ex Ctena orbiculata)]|nr:toll/interleukin-1 receptor domain-containing protein [Candidatus Thiodiazotropha taylori]